MRQLAGRAEVRKNPVTLAYYFVMRILIVDDEIQIADSIVRGLKRQGFAVDSAYSGEDALKKAGISAYDLICLDIMMPEMSGLEVCKRLRADSDLYKNPRILMLTAMTSIQDRVTGLDEGADDYLIKPFDFDELLARVRALLRRGTEVGNNTVSFGDLKMDIKTRRVTSRSKKGSDKMLSLTNKEFLLLQFFLSHPDEVFSQEELLEYNWDENSHPMTFTVKVTISKLRKKLLEAKSNVMIKTMVGAGYKVARRDD